jgi:hypothetical protein
LVQESEHQWLVLRDDLAHPTAVIRYLEKPVNGGNYRVVRWAPRSEDRRLFDYFRTLEMADMAVTFIEKHPDDGHAHQSAASAPPWERFERLFWSEAPAALIVSCSPPWFDRDRRAQAARV